MKNTPKKKEMTMDELAGMVAIGFDNIEKRMESLATKDELEGFKKRTQENFMKVRRDILELNDRFVSKSEFDTFMVRFNALRARVKAKK